MAVALADIHVKINPDIKSQSEEILGKIGISMSNLINMTLRQVIYQKRIPFETSLEYEMPRCMQLRTEGEIKKYLEENLAKDFDNPKTYPQEEIENMFHVGEAEVAA